MVEDQDVEDADAQGPPVGAVVGGETVHGLVGAEPGEEPSAVGDGAEAEHVLVAAAFDRIPGGAAAGLARADPAAPRTRARAARRGARP